MRLSAMGVERGSRGVWVGGMVVVMGAALLLLMVIMMMLLMMMAMALLVMDARWRLGGGACGWCRGA